MILLKNLKIKLNFQQACLLKSSSLPNKSKITLWLKTAWKTLIYQPDPLNEPLNKLKTYGCTHLTLTVRVVDPEESACLNLSYRHKNNPTNVLSFPCLEWITPHDFYLGDLAICAALVEQEAIQQNKPVSSHWTHLVVHGFLHLLGYDHESPNDATVMEALEVRILGTLGIENPY